jgi:hypothetical protein
MSPIRETFANISITPFGFGRTGGGEVFYIATAKTGVTTYGSSVYSDPTTRTIYWSMVDQNNLAIWTTVSPAGVAGSSFSTSGQAYTSMQGSVMADSSGNVMLSTPEPTLGAGSSQIIESTSTGTKLWARQASYQGSTAYQLVQDNSGNIYGMARNTSGPPQAGNTQFGMVKYSSSGTLSFRNTYLGSSPNGAYSNGSGSAIAVNSAGSSIYLAGAITDNAGFMAATLVKTNGSGVVQWTQTYNSAAGTTPVLALDSSENSYLFWNAPSHVTKFNSSGTYQWGRTYNSTFADATTDSSGNVYGLFTDQTTTMYVVKWNSSGTIQWQRSITRTSGALKPAQFTINNKTSGFHATTVALVFAASDNNSAMLFKIPLDGSLTGSYVVNGLTYTIAASSLTEGASSNFFGAITTAGTSAGSDSAGTGTMASASPTIITKVIP